MKIRKYKPLLCVSFVFISFLFAHEVNPQEPERVRVYYQPVISIAPIIIAYEEGYFKKQGIEVDFVKARDTAEALMLLMQGSLDVIYGALTGGMYNVVKEGKYLKFVAGHTYYLKGNKFAGVVIKSNLTDSADNLKNLKGKKVAVPILGSLPHYFVETLLKENGVLIKDIELVIMPFDTISVAVNAGIVDAGFLVEPFITLLKGKSGISFISFSEKFPDTPSSFIIYGNNLLNERHQVGIKFMAAYLMGCVQYNNGKTKRNIEILRKHLILDKEMLNKIEWPVIYPEGISNIGILNDYQDWLFEKNYIEEKINTKNMIDKSFMEKANNILSNYRE